MRITKNWIPEKQNKLNSSTYYDLNTFWLNYNIVNTIIDQRMEWFIGHVVKKAFSFSTVCIIAPELLTVVQFLSEGGNVQENIVAPTLICVMKHCGQVWNEMYALRI